MVDTSKASPPRRLAPWVGGTAANPSLSRPLVRIELVASKHGFPLLRRSRALNEVAELQYNASLQGRSNSRMPSPQECWSEQVCSNPCNRGLAVSFGEASA